MFTSLDLKKIFRANQCAVSKNTAVGVNAEQVTGQMQRSISQVPVLCGRPTSEEGIDVSSYPYD